MFGRVLHARTHMHSVGDTDKHSCSKTLGLNMSLQLEYFETTELLQYSKKYGNSGNNNMIVNTAEVIIERLERFFPAP